MEVDGGRVFKRDMEIDWGGVVREGYGNGWAGLGCRGAWKFRGRGCREGYGYGYFEYFCKLGSNSKLSN